VGLSQFYFTKLFKDRTGKTFVEYLTDLRIDSAKKLLREDIFLRVREICYMVGHNDPKYFCRISRKTVGVTPAGIQEWAR